MRLLIAGWHGQIARALVELAAANPAITALSVGRAALDLCTPSSIRSTFIAARPDIMINTAAYTAVDKAESDQHAAFDLNCAGAAAFATLAARNQTPIIHLSTNYVFDGTKDDPYTEDDAPAPNTVYGRSKLEGELAVANANQNHLILRASWVFSPYGHNFVSNVLDLARQRSQIDIVDDQIGCPTYAVHLAAEILDIASRIAGNDQSVRWGTYHIASTGAVTWFGLARRLLDISSALGGPSAEVRPITGKDYSTTAPRPANARLDCSKLQSAFGIRMPEWSDGLAECVERQLSSENRQRPSSDVG